MTIFRAVYIRAGKPAGATFGVRSSLFAAEEAARWAEAVLMRCVRVAHKDAQLLTVREVPRKGK